jgi:hypothetical protein
MQRRNGHDIDAESIRVSVKKRRLLTHDNLEDTST